MSRPVRLFSTAVLAGLLWLAGGGLARAALFSPQVFPPQTNVALKRSARLGIVWQLTTDAGPRIDSPQGVLEDSAGNLYLTVTQPLSASAAAAGQPLPGGGVSRQTVRLRERLVLPAAVLARAERNGVTRLLYRRQFSDGGGGTATLNLLLNITGAGAAAFGINYLGMRFDDDSVRRLVAPGATLRARAQVRFTGSGELQGVWEVADPSSASGTPVFRPLRVVRRALFGGQAATLASPPLPTGRSGLYRLRLRLTDPALAEAPELQYYVSRDTGRDARPIELLAPAPRARFTAATRFRWRPLAGARAYQLEIHAAAPRTAGRPLAGRLIDARRAEVEAGALLWRHLTPGRAYRWRVLAIDADGRRVGVSELRPLVAAPP